MEQLSYFKLIQEVVRNQGNLYNVVYLYGAAGKTASVAEAVLREIQDQRPGARVVHTNGAAFCKGILEGSGEYLGDVLIFEDLQTLAGREIAEQILYGILDAYLESGKQVIVTGDAPLYEMLCLASRIQAQLLGGLNVPVTD